MIEYGKTETDISIDQLRSIVFSDYFQCYQQTESIEKYYTQHNSSIWQMFDDECPNFIRDLANKVPQNFRHSVTSVIKIDPGQTIPYHVDKHYMLKKQYGDGITYRYLIFLEDWKRGHYYEVHDQPFTKWRKGDWVKFDNTDWHLAGNMGEEPFYSAQVTVLV